jgi:hypothetical protein
MEAPRRLKPAIVTRPVDLEAESRRELGCRTAEILGVTEPEDLHDLGNGRGALELAARKIQPMRLLDREIRVRVFDEPLHHMAHLDDLVGRAIG